MNHKHRENSLIAAIAAHRNKSKVILESYNFGVYVLYFEDANTEVMTRDDLCDTVDEAKQFCREDYGVLANDWEEILDHSPIMVTS